MWYNSRRRFCCTSLYGCRLPALCTTVVLTASQKMPLRASIFASWYNNVEEPEKQLKENSYAYFSS